MLVTNFQRKICKKYIDLDHINSISGCMKSKVLSVTIATGYTALHILRGWTSQSAYGRQIWSENIVSCM